MVEVEDASDLCPGEREKGPLCASCGGFGCVVPTKGLLSGDIGCKLRMPLRTCDLKDLESHVERDVDAS